MNRMVIVLIGLVLAASLSYGQVSTPAQAPAVPAAIGHGSFPVKVVKTLDSSKLKEDDTVEVETAGAFKLPDGTLVPMGSKLTGLVTSAKARSKGDAESQLTVTFNKLSIANGKQLSIKGVVQAVFPAPDEEMDPSMTGAATTAAGGSAGGATAGAGGASVGIVTNAKSGSNMDTTSKGQAAADPKATGVQGINNLQLDNGVLTSKGKNVKLGSGVRMIVRVDILG